MRAKNFGTALFGYDKISVSQRMAEMEKELEEATKEIEQLRAQLARTEARNEELNATVAAMRRQQIQVLTGNDDAAPVTVLVGPTDSLGVITGLIDALEGSPHLMVQFRIFRDGFYRIDGRAHDRAKLVEWLRSQSAVRNIAVDQETLHVVPRGVSA